MDSHATGMQSMTVPGLLLTNLGKFTIIRVYGVNYHIGAISLIKSSPHYSDSNPGYLPSQDCSDKQKEEKAATKIQVPFPGLL